MELTTELLDSIKIIPLLNTLHLEKISDEEYFSQKYSNYISNSRLGLINPNQDNDPKAFFEGLNKHSKYSDALIFGSAVHCLSLQPELFQLVTTIDRPTAKMGFMCDELYKIKSQCGFITDEDIIKASDKINYYKDKMTPERIQAVRDAGEPYWKSRLEYSKDMINENSLIYLDPKSRDRVLQCVEALNKNKSIQELLKPKGILEDPISDNEQAILLDVQIEIPGFDSFILKLKAKLDNYTIDRETNTIVVNDIKTIGKILSEFDCEGGNIERFHYHREISLYSWLLSLCAKKFYDIENPTIRGNYLVVSTIPQYYTKVVSMSAKDFKDGWKEFIYLLKLVAYYTATEYKDFGIWNMKN